MNIVAGYFALDRPSKRLLLRTLFALISAWSQVHLQRYSRARHFDAPHVTPTTDYRIDQIVWAVSRVARILPGSNCLVQALAGRALLLESGHPAVLAIGVQRLDGTALAAHAWVEMNGKIVIGQLAEGNFVPLTSANH